MNEAELIRSLREALAHSQGKLTLKTTKVPRRPAGFFKLEEKDLKEINGARADESA